jgi:uncharacterized protein YpbB
LLNNFILSLFAHGFKAKPSTLFHLLKGKRTSSVLIYGYFYQALQFSGLFTKLTQDQFDKIIFFLINKGLLEEHDGEVQLTKSGAVFLAESVHFPDTDAMDQYSYGRHDADMWRLLRFAVQVESFYQHQENHYLPIDNSPMLQLKIRKWFVWEKESPGQFVMELTELFALLKAAEADFLAQQFSGYEVLGKNVNQLLHENELFTVLYTKNCLHHVFRIVESNQDKFSTLSQLWQEQFFLNKNRSMLETRELLLEGLFPDEIATRKRVKVSTVNDHLLELALVDPSFPWAAVLEKETLERFNHLDEAQLLQLRFRTLNEATPIDFLQFRLGQIYQLGVLRGVR